MDNYKTIQTFVEVAKNGSLTAAARTLGISRALVSRQITDLERRLKVRLLNRSTRLVNLTEAGQNHFEFCKRLLAELAEEEQSLLGKDDEIEGPVSVGAPEFAGNRDIGHAITGFLSRYPQVKIELTLGELKAPHGPIESVFDVILQTSPGRSVAARARRVATLQHVLCCSPAYLTGVSAPRAPSELASHACLVYSNDTVWRLSRRGKTAKLAVTPAFSSNSLEVLARVAIGGWGIAKFPERLVRDDLARGTLVCVLKDWHLPTQSLYAAFTRRGNQPQRVRLFAEFLSEWFRSA